MSKPKKILILPVSIFLNLLWMIVLSGHLYASRPASAFISSPEHTLVAINDTFYVITGCGQNNFGGSVMQNDVIPDCITAKVQYVHNPESGILSFGSNGNFVYLTEPGFNGLIRFKYIICDADNMNTHAEAEVLLYVQSDFDCDEIFDMEDIDDDNDEIPDIFEGNGKTDSDGDGIPDSLDIDSDNDGITDNTEWQDEKTCMPPSGIDTNKNGLDDFYELRFEGDRFIAVDTDNDKIPDFLDTDSDNDHIPDLTEALDLNLDNLPDQQPSGDDHDDDGLDDAFDIVHNWRQAVNSTGSNVPLPDHNNNGIRDFREKQSGKTGFTFSVFPNPSSGRFVVKTGTPVENGQAKVRIINSNGTIIYSTTTPGNPMNIDVSGIDDGLYFLNIVTPDFDKTECIIIKQ